MSLLKLNVSNMHVNKTAYLSYSQKVLPLDFQPKTDSSK